MKIIQKIKSKTFTIDLPDDLKEGDSLVVSKVIDGDPIFMGFFCTGISYYYKLETANKQTEINEISKLSGDF